MNRTVTATKAMPARSHAHVLEVHNVAKHFPPNVQALGSASLTIRRGEVHCLLGANGAGKSTLMKIIAGAYRPDRGELRVDGREVQFRTPQDARRAGVSMIYQELDLVAQLTVEENLLLGHVPARFGLVARQTRRDMARQALDRVGASFGPQARVETLSLANQQLTAIARALTTRARLIVMDEPSASLNEREISKVFDVIRGLVREGVSVLYVSHRLAEIRMICDRVTVLRGGDTVATFDVAGADEKAMVAAVVGEHRKLLQRQERRAPQASLALHVRQLDGPHGLRIRDLRVRKGEIVGLTGLNGAGRSTLLRALFGVGRFEGDVQLNGGPYLPRSPRQAIACGVGLVPESRKTQGLVLDAPIYINATLPFLRRGMLVRRAALRRQADVVLRDLSTRLSSLDQPVRQLSGGNQQKVVFAKWLVEGSSLLLLDEPSRGLDVGAKADLYALARKLADAGAAVVVASSELDELHAHCDLIWVLHEGRNVAAFDPTCTAIDVVLQTTILGHLP